MNWFANGVAKRESFVKSQALFSEIKYLHLVITNTTNRTREILSQARYLITAKLS